jgi:hypothetical protein
MSTERHFETFSTEWNSIGLQITWEANWLNLTDNHGYDVAHLDIEGMSPERAALPITETGYRSHFTSPEIASFGGPVGFVLAWLDEAACSPEWQAQAAVDRQFALF